MESAGKEFLWRNILFFDYYCFAISTDMAKLHSLLALQQFMQGLGEDMDEAELVRSTWTETNERTNERNQRTDITN